MKNEMGFTLIELIIVLSILGILAATGVSYFANPSPFEQRGFTDQTLSSLRYAQRLASASGCDVRVEMDSTDLTVSHWNSCQPGTHSSSTTVFSGPDFENDFIQEKPDGLSVTEFDLYFDEGGKPYHRSSGNQLSSDLSINIGDFTLTIDKTTGFVYL